MIGKCHHHHHHHHQIVTQDHPRNTLSKWFWSKRDRFLTYGLLKINMNSPYIRCNVEYCSYMFSSSICKEGSTSPTTIEKVSDLNIFYMFVPHIFVMGCLFSLFLSCHIPQLCLPQDLRSWPFRLRWLQWGGRPGRLLERQTVRRLGPGWTWTGNMG